MRRFVLVAALALAACGPASTTTPPGDTSTAAPQTTAAPSSAEMQAKVVALPAPYNAANYEAGRTVFAQCRSCHTIDASEANRVGPHLHGVIGRHAGSVPGFAYSAAMQSQTYAWDAAHLDHYLENPAVAVPNNRMGFAGVRDATQRRDLIAFIQVESTQP